jgi:hypothetical protein
VSAFASATLDLLVNAAASFSATIQPSPAELAEKTIDYAEAKEAYFKALRAEIPELMNIATGGRRGHPSWTSSPGRSRRVDAILDRV